jgi:hypothetical protein
MNMSDHTEDETKRILIRSTYGKTHKQPQINCPTSQCNLRPDIAIGTTARANPIPEINPKANFASVTLVFLEDWQNGRLNSDEVCETLLAASVARGLITSKNKP